MTEAHNLSDDQKRSTKHSHSRYHVILSQGYSTRKSEKELTSRTRATLIYNIIGKITSLSVSIILLLSEYS